MSHSSPKPKRHIFSSGLAVGLIRLAFAPLEWALGKVTGEKAEPLLDNPARLAPGDKRRYDTRAP